VVFDETGSVQPFFCAYKSKTTIIMSNTSIRRKSPVRPVRQEPTSFSKVFDPSQAKFLLKEMYGLCNELIDQQTQVELLTGTLDHQITFIHSQVTITVLLQETQS